MKFVLPAFAVGLIVLMVAWPGQFGHGDGFRLSFADLDPDPDGNLGVVRARFAGTDSKRRPFFITAERAVQQSEQFQVFNLEALQADITLDNGTWISVSAIGGIFDRGSRHLHLEGPIEIFTNVGYELHAEEASVDLGLGAVKTGRPVNGHGPLGAIWAEGMQFTSEGGLIAFSGGVRVVLNATARK